MNTFVILVFLDKLFSSMNFSPVLMAIFLSSLLLFLQKQNIFVKQKKHKIKSYLPNQIHIPRFPASMMKASSESSCSL